MRVLITGSTRWDDEVAIFEKLASIPVEYGVKPEDVVIVHGCAAGADNMAGDAAQALNMQIEEHPADWKQYGKKAGPIRNREMAKAGADVCFAFWNGASHGTFHTMYECVIRGIPVDVTMLKSE